MAAIQTLDGEGQKMPVTFLPRRSFSTTSIMVFETPDESFERSDIATPGD
jgi:hypothetical protein